MVGEIAAHHALAKDMIDGVIERTGGVPLFVEEVTRLLLERGEAGGLQAIPLTLQQSLAARLDRLGEAREVAQIGAYWAVNSVTPCCAPWAGSTTPPSSPRSTGSSTRTSSSPRAPARRRSIASSTR